MEEKSEPVDPFRNVTECAVVRPFLYPDDVEKSKNYIKNLVDFDDEVPNLKIDVLKMENDDTLNALDGSPLLDQVVDASCKTLPLTDPTYGHNDDGPISPLPNQVDDVSCKTLSSSPL
ncbi:hypothetical protein K7X08_015806 [Anisodus acutangulus]|uniref:Uncharacterized protein n=1 Tax=Anisodus acutangulus TaxID=402998 RepID=A0A9Q1LC53_9SOLA|nr:hypothetical protein K7X08_015806 [Anisodus acutangulus]